MTKALGLAFRHSKTAGRGKMREEWETGALAFKPYSSQALLKDMRDALKYLYPGRVVEGAASSDWHLLAPVRMRHEDVWSRGHVYSLQGKGWLRHKATNAVFRYIAADLEDLRRLLSYLGHEEA